MDWKKIRPWILPSVPGKSANLPVGLHHFSRERDGQVVRYHLRIETSGQALLIVAASEVVRLSRSGATVALGLLEGKSTSEINSDLGKIPAADNLIAEVRQLIDEMGQPNKRYPIFNLPDANAAAGPVGLIAPFQADVVPADREQLRLILQRIWDAGIPHVRLVNVDGFFNDPAKVQDLVSAVEFAEDIGMIMGIRAAASQLMTTHNKSRIRVMDQLAQVGLDYVVLPWGVTEANHRSVFGDADFEAMVPAIERVSHWEIATVLETALVRENVLQFEQELDCILRHDVAHVEVFALAHHPDTVSDSPPPTGGASGSLLPELNLNPFEAQQLRQLASWIEDLADNRCVQMVWLPPVCSSDAQNGYSIVELIRRGPRAGGDVSIRVEADGSVIPPRGRRESVGKIQQSTWEQLWSNPAFTRYQELVQRDTRCQECPRMAICASDCPAAPSGWADESKLGSVRKGV